MTRTARVLYGLLMALVVCVLLAPNSAQAAERSVLADFDGDGQHDRATLDRMEPSLLRVWLSSTRSTAILRSRTPITGIAARDLDGDRRAELIAGGTATGLQVWTKRHKGFSRLQPRDVAPGTLDRPLGHNVEEGPGDAPAAVTSAAASLNALTVSLQPRAPALLAAPLLTAPAIHPRSFRPIAPFAPRPPPFLR